MCVKLACNDPNYSIYNEPEQGRGLVWLLLTGQKTNNPFVYLEVIIVIVLPCQASG